MSFAHEDIRWFDVQMHNGRVARVQVSHCAAQLGEHRDFQAGAALDFAAGQVVESVGERAACSTLLIHELNIMAAERSFNGRFESLTLTCYETST